MIKGACLTKYIDYLNIWGLVGFCLFVFQSPKTCAFAQRECHFWLLSIWQCFCCSLNLPRVSPSPGSVERHWKNSSVLELALQTPPLTLQSVLHNNSSPCYVVVIAVSPGCSHLLFEGGKNQSGWTRVVSFRLLETELPWDLGGRKSVLKLQGRMCDRDLFGIISSCI